MTGRRVVGLLVVVVLSTAVIPPGSAWIVNESRMSRASTDLTALAERLRGNDAALRRLGVTVEVLCGPGQMPRALSNPALHWVNAPRGPLAAAVPDQASVPVDPWGNCYVLNLSRLSSSAPAVVWILSAGPDGIIDTPFLADAAEGNDVARRVLH